MENQRPRHLHGCSPSLLLVLLLLQMMLLLVRCDYPPPSEDAPGYYSLKHEARPVMGSSSSSHGDGYSSDWNGRDWAMLGNPHPSKCVAIPQNMSLCHGIGYDQMRIPNLLEHETLKEATSQAATWVRLRGLRCHPDTQVFLCSLFAPVCLDRPIWPCKSLCEAVKVGCEGRMNNYGFPWPEMLRCDRYPSEDDLCIGLRNENNKEEDPSCSACQADTFESTVDHFCQSDFAMRIKVKQAIIAGPDMKIDTEKKKKKTFKAGSLSTIELRESSLYIVNGSNCDCEALDGANNGSSFIVMGNMVGGRPVLSFIHRIEKESKDVNRAMRVARKPDVCTKTDVIGANKEPSTEKKVKGAKGGKAKVKAGQSGKGNRKTASPPSESRQTTVKSTPLATTTTVAAATKRANRNKNSRRKNNTPATPQLFY